MISEKTHSCEVQHSGACDNGFPSVLSLLITTDTCPLQEQLVCHIPRRTVTVQAFKHLPQEALCSLSLDTECRLPVGLGSLCFLVQMPRLKGGAQEGELWGHSHHTAVGMCTQTCTPQACTDTTSQKVLHGV